MSNNITNLNKADIKISKHAYKRLVERYGWVGKKELYSIVEYAYNKGKTLRTANDRAIRFIKRKYKQYDFNKICYRVLLNDKIFVFDRFTHTLITTFTVPENFK